MRKNRFLILIALLYPLINLMFFRGFNFETRDVLLMLFVGVGEELFFRGFLLKLFFEKLDEKWIYITSGIFAICHGVNLFHESPVFVVLQIISAFVVGLLYSHITLQFKSVLPCIILHSITNVTYLFTAQSMTPIKTALLIISNVLIVIYLLRFKKHQQERENEILH